MHCGWVESVVEATAHQKTQGLHTANSGKQGTCVCGGKGNSVNSLTDKTVHCNDEARQLNLITLVSLVSIHCQSNFPLAFVLC